MRTTLAHENGLTRKRDQYYVFQNIVASSVHMEQATDIEDWRYHADWWWISTLIYMSLLTEDF